MLTDDPAGRLTPLESATGETNVRVTMGTGGYIRKLGNVRKMGS